MPETPELNSVRERLSAHTAACLANVERLESLRDRLATVIEERRAVFRDLLHGEPYWVEDFESRWWPGSEASHD